MIETELIRPCVELEATYHELLADFASYDEDPVPWVLALPTRQFDQLIQTLDGFSEGIGLHPGFVPNSTFWLVDGNRQLVGVSNLRHELTPFLEREGGHIGFGIRPALRRQGHATRILKLTLVEAEKLGLDRVLLVCDHDNEASARVILNNGGVFDSEYVSEDGQRTMRYWIRI